MLSDSNVQCHQSPPAMRYSRYGKWGRRFRSCCVMVATIMVAALIDSSSQCTTNAMLMPGHNNNIVGTTTSRARHHHGSTTTNTTQFKHLNNHNATSFDKKKKKKNPLFLFKRFREEEESSEKKPKSRLEAVANKGLNDVQDTTTTTAMQQQESVHLKLNSEAMMKRVDDEHGENNNDSKDDDASNNNNKNKMAVVLHTYSNGGVLLKGVNMTRRKFCAWVNYTLGLEKKEFDESCVSTEHVSVDNNDIRNELRKLWLDRRLLCERTEVLAVYQSDSSSSSSQTSSHDNNKKRGGFPDLLHLYAERLAAIIQDEREEEQIAKGELRVFNDTIGNEQPVPSDLMDILNGGLLGWLQREYGTKETRQLLASHLLELPEKKKFEVRGVTGSFQRVFPSPLLMPSALHVHYNKYSGASAFYGLVPKSISLLL